MTRVIPVDPVRPQPNRIRLAAEALRRGELVAFPTETVYGLGANAFDEDAVLEIFRAKGRPQDNPIIVHIAELKELELLVREVPKKAHPLIASFWPGPLTLIMPKAELLPEVTTAGLDTVAVRMPSHPIARALIKASSIPIAAPSANLAGRPSPTDAQHVLRDLQGRISLILDGGHVEHGLESTVLDLTQEPPELLRPGPITAQQLEGVIGRIRVSSLAKALGSEAPRPRAPGLKYRHYAPRVELILLEGDPNAIRMEIRRLHDELRASGKRVAILAPLESREGYRPRRVKVMGSREDLRTIAKGLFRALRELEEEGIDVALVEGIEPEGVGLAIMNRLRKAASHRLLCGA